jgi:hypothetical protein
MGRRRDTRELHARGFRVVRSRLHPFRDRDGIQPPRRWRDVAAGREKIVGPGTRVDDLDDLRDVDRLPDEGEIPEEICGTLSELLGQRTTTPGVCSFAIWSGWGLFIEGTPYIDPSIITRREQRRISARRRKEQAEFEALPQIEEPHRSTGRSYLLFRGPIDAACAFEPMVGHRVSPSYWWPDDRAWSVVTEIDGYSTYVGGDRGTVDAILRHEELETIKVDRQVRIC